MTLFHSPSVQSPSAWDKVNLTVAGMIARLNDSGYRYKITPAENAAGLVGTLTFGYDPGDVRRYGADPTGAADSSVAFHNAMLANSQVYDSFPGGGNYLFNATCVIPKYPMRILGQAKDVVTANVGTRVTLATAAGAGAAAFQTTATAFSIHIEKIGFNFQTVTTGQIGIRFAELRSSAVADCYFQGAAVAGCTVVGIQFDGSGTFTGGIKVRDCHFAVLLFGVHCKLACTSVRIYDNEFYGNLAITGPTNAIGIDQTCTGVTCIGNTIQGWTIGINSQGAYVMQAFNHYEGNTTNFQWVRGAGNLGCWNTSIGEAMISGGAPVIPFNDTDACNFIGAAGNPSQIDVGGWVVSRGFTEWRRANRLGDWVQPAFNAGLFTANGGGAWTVTSGEQLTLAYRQVGKSCTVKWWINASTLGGGASTQLQITIPAGLSALTNAGVACYVTDGTYNGMGRAEIITGSPTLISIKTANGGGFTNSAAVTTYGEICFDIA